jgi:hypothetical protein
MPYLSPFKFPTRDEEIAEIAGELNQFVGLALHNERDTPVGRAARYAIRVLGERLAAMGVRTSEMLNMAEDVGAKDNDGRSKYVDEYSVRVTIIDKWWDGIADKDGSVWTA